MFNLPFPTDSLYKFAFMFGLVLMIFSIYFKDAHLNRFDRKQVKSVVDSLERLKSKYEMAKNSDKMHFNASIRGMEKLERLGFLNQTTINTLMKYFESVYQAEKLLKNYEANLGIIRDTTYFADLRAKVFKETALKIDSLYNEKILQIKKDVELNQSKFDEDYKSFYFMFFAGIILFIPGLILWYVKVQVLQDKLLKLQLAEAKGKNTDKFNPNKFFGRTHFEPQILPRPKVRNRV